jgi:tetratricopeptide (TPR) repeat protein
LLEAITELVRQRRATSDHENALGYLELALELVPEDWLGLRFDLLEQLGRENEEVAEELAHDWELQQARHTAAARCYEQAADLAPLDEPRLAALLWASAQQFDRAGRSGDARRLLLRFIEERSTDPRMPPALLQVGQLYAADGRFEKAVEYYQRLSTKYPRLEEAVRARLLTADSLMAMGEAQYPQAETILRDLLEDNHIAPEAPVFRDALFELCDLLYQQKRYGQAISQLEDFLVFYPEDPERYRIRFMLADAYRGSAYALRSDETAGAAAAREQVARERFGRAAELFEEYASGGDAAAALRESQAQYQRLALFYRGDCLFELNDPTSLTEALSTYRQAGARYQSTPAALTAQVQIANIFLRQGRLIEAARSVERARWLLGSMPDAAFAEYDDGMDRASWDSFLSAVRSSNLFRGVIRDAQ